MARGMCVALGLVALLAGGWGFTQHLQVKALSEKHQVLVDNLESENEKLQAAFAENRRLTMAQAGAQTKLEDAQTRIRDLEAEVEQAKEELAATPVVDHDPKRHWVEHKKRHAKMMEKMEAMQVRFDGNLFGVGNDEDAEEQFEKAKAFFELKQEPLSEEQAEQLKAVFAAEPGNTQTITQTDDGNGITIVMSAVAGNDAERDERIGKEAAEILTPAQLKLLRIWQKMRGKKTFQRTQTFQFETK